VSTDRRPAAGAGPGRLLALLGLMPAGLLLGLVAAFYPQASTSIGPLDLPWGLLLACTIVAVGIRLAAVLLRSRLAGVLVVLGWLIGSVAAAVPTPDGDLILAADWQTYAYLGASLLLGGFLVALPLPTRGENAAQGAGSTS